MAAVKEEEEEDEEKESTRRRRKRRRDGRESSLSWYLHLPLPLVRKRRSDFKGPREEKRVGA
jgi:hypothetical protein